MINTLMYQYWFLSNRDISYYKKYKMYEYFGDAYHIFFATETMLKASKLLKASQIDNFLYNRSKVDLNKIFEEFNESPYSFITVEDEKYPKKLRTIYNPPYGLFYNGKLPDFSKSVSIVGARKCSAYGKNMAELLGLSLSNAGYTVVSGMARGIDTCAHTGCLKGTCPTVAVLGNGVDIVYPKENGSLYEKIAASGAVISEFPISAQPKPENFPIRNRIVAGLSDITIVVEAKLKSGSLITADMALEMGRDIYVVPGRIGDSLSEGCNKLIDQGAGIIYSIQKFIDEITGQENKPIVQIKTEANKTMKLTKEQLLVFSLFDYYPKSISQVQIECGMDYLHLISIIFSLVKEDLITEIFKNQYILK